MWNRSFWDSVSPHVRLRSQDETAGMIGISRAGRLSLIAFFTITFEMAQITHMSQEIMHC